MADLHALHTSNRLEDLADALARVVEAPLSSPFAKELILVPSRALAVWLSTELANRLGIWANPEFLTPRAWLGSLLDEDAGALDWAVAAALPRHLSEDAFAEVRRYLEDDHDGTKRVALASRIARLFERYVLYRPAMVERWKRGEDDHWQARLFRALPGNDLVERVARLAADVETGRREDVPERVAIFCVGRIPPLLQRVVDAFAAVTQVYTYELELGEAFDVSERSVSVHACHGAVRECEVLRDQLLDALSTTPDLEPRDVRVLCPELDEYAVAIDAVFGVDPKDPRHVPYRIADRPAGAALPVAEGLLALLDVASSRMTAPAVLDLLYREPIRARFGLGESDVETIREWIAGAGIRWGADEAHRAEVGQPALRQNTWAFGIERLLLGYAMGAAGDDTFAGVLPADDLDGGSASALGALAAFVETLGALRKELAGRATLEVWRARLVHALETFLASGRTTEFQHQIVRDALGGIAERASAAGFAEEVPLAVVRDALAAELDESGGGFDAGSGAITFARLAPGRTTPARVVALLGMNDGAFPRAPRALGFDLMAAAPEEEDPSPRDDDRRVFREALAAARERVIITFVGRSIENDAERPPSVVISELLDATGLAVVPHALHAFSPRYFRGDDPRLFSYASAEAAKAMVARRQEVPSFVGAPLPPPPGEDDARPVTIDELCTFFAHPVEAFVKHRVGAYVPNDVEPLEDREPFDVEHLAKWRLQTDLVARARAGEDVSVVPAALAASGDLPMGTLGRIAYERLHEGPAEMGALVRTMLGANAPEPLEIDLRLGDAALVGWLRTVGARAQVIHRFSQGRGKHVLDAWIRHLAMNARGVRRKTYLLSKDKSDATVVHVFRPVGGAKEHLAELVALYRLGQRVPLPLFPDTAWTYAEARRKGESAEAALARARRKYTGPGDGKEGYDGANNAYVAKIYGERDPIDPAFRLFEQPMDPSPPSFVEVAVRVFQPLLTHLEETE